MAAEGGERYQYSEAHLGTSVQLVFYAKGGAQAGAIARQAFAKVEELDGILSDYKKESELNKLCSATIGESHTVGPDLLTVLSFAQELSVKTEGAFDVTVGKSSQAWRDGKSTLGAREVSYLDVVINRELSSVTLLKPLQIDLGGIGKGYIADQLMHLLEEAGIESAAVVVGGESRLSAPPPSKEGWRIAVEDPEMKRIGYLVLHNTAVSTSGDSYQFFEADGQRHSHLIDPLQNKSKSDRRNVITVASSSMQADAWATALRILPKEQALKIADKEQTIEALMLTKGEPAQRTEQFPKLHN
jgi:thiamine biosynthesis lipoprotein